MGKLENCVKPLLKTELLRRGKLSPENEVWIANKESWGLKKVSKDGKGGDPQGLNQPLDMVFADSNATPGKCVARPLKGGEMKLGVLGSPHPGSVIINRTPIPLETSVYPHGSLGALSSSHGITNIDVSVISAQSGDQNNLLIITSVILLSIVLDSVAIFRAGRSLFLKKAVPLRSSMC